MIARTRSLPRHRRTINLARASALALVALISLTACGTSGVTLPVDDAPIAAFVVEAETALSHSPAFDVGRSEFASQGGYITQPVEIPNSRSGAPVAEIAFDLDEADEYALWVRVFAPSKDSDAVYLGFNGETLRVHPPKTDRYVWLQVTTAQLAATRNVISLGHGEAGLKIDMFAVVQGQDVSALELENLVQPASSQRDSVPSDPEPGVRASPTLRGDPSFDAASLSDDVALWYGRLWHDIEHGSFDPIAVAGRDCIYQYGRTLHTYVQSVLVAFRLTGDLALLDHVDDIAERMRAQLRDEWRGTLDGTDGTRDGYLNWVDRYEGGTFRGKDTMRVNEIKTHALVAMMAYALEANRDLPSPGGRNYAAHADFWRDYLVNHFEAKWRERHDVPTAFPIMTRPGTHTYHSWIKWHYYMGLLTGSDAYTNEAHRMADNVWADLRPIETAGGTAYVWAGSIASAGGSNNYLQRTTYARYVYGDMIEFHLEGFHNWASTSQMERFARTFTTFVIDTNDPLNNGFAPDVGGGVTRAGSKSGDTSRITVDRYRESSYPLMAAWDTTGRIEELNEAVYASIGSRGAAWLTAGSMLNASWSNDSLLASGHQP